MRESNNQKIIFSSKLMHTLWSVTILQIHTSAEIGIGLFHSKKQPLAWLLRSVGSSIDQRVLVLLSGLGKMTMVSLIQNILRIFYIFHSHLSISWVLPSLPGNFATRKEQVLSPRWTVLVSTGRTTRTAERFTILHQIYQNWQSMRATLCSHGSLKCSCRKLTIQSSLLVVLPTTVLTMSAAQLLIETAIRESPCLLKASFILVKIWFTRSKISQARQTWHVGV